MLYDNWACFFTIGLLYITYLVYFEILIPLVFLCNWWLIYKLSNDSITSINNNNNSLYASLDTPLFTSRYTAARPGTSPTSPSVVYAIALFWPEDNTLHLGALASHASNKMEISMLGVPGNLQWTEAEPSLGGGVLIKIPLLPGESLPCKHSWAFKISIPSKAIQDSDKGEL